MLIAYAICLQKKITWGYRSAPLVPIVFNHGLVDLFSKKKKYLCPSVGSLWLILSFCSIGCCFLEFLLNFSPWSNPYQYLGYIFLDNGLGYIWTIIVTIINIYILSKSLCLVALQLDPLLQWILEKGSGLPSSQQDGDDSQAVKATIPDLPEVRRAAWNSDLSDTFHCTIN